MLKKIVLDIRGDLKSLSKRFIVFLTVVLTISVLFSIIDFDSILNNNNSVTFFDSFSSVNLKIKVASALSPLNTFLSILYVYLLTQGKRSSFFYGLLSSITYAYIAFSLDYIGEFVLALIYIPIFMFGMRSAYKTDLISTTKLKNNKVKKLDPQSYITIVIVITILVIGWFYLIPEISNSMIGYYAFENSPAQWGIDSITNGLNIVGIILMIRGYRNQYDIWLLVNILSIVIYSLIMIDGQYFAISLVIVFITYLAATVYGIRSWYFGVVEDKDVSFKKNKNNFKNNHLDKMIK